jgi:multicomponent Na+:H+ antiporter subunit F
MRIFEISLIMGLIILSIALLVTMVRFVIGPTLPDRVTAFDLLAATIIGMICIYAVLTGDNAFFDIAIVLSLIAFLGAMSFAYYLKNKSK